jgi:hypothetical protein
MPSDYQELCSVLSPSELKLQLRIEALERLLIDEKYTKSYLDAFCETWKSVQVQR